MTSTAQPDSKAPAGTSPSSDVDDADRGLSVAGERVVLNGYGLSQTIFALESALDDLARRRRFPVLG
mgnify:CR=1 FL=1